MLLVGTQNDGAIMKKILQDCSKVIPLIEIYCKGYQAKMQKR